MYIDNQNMLIMAVKIGKNLNNLSAETLKKNDMEYSAAISSDGFTEPF